MLWPSIGKCLSFGAAFGLSLLGALWLAARGDRRPSRLPLSLFVVAGLSGTTAMHLHCKMGGALHVGLGHGGVLTLLLLIPLFARLRDR